MKDINIITKVLSNKQLHIRISLRVNPDKSIPKCYLNNFTISKLQFTTTALLAFTQLSSFMILDLEKHYNVLIYRCS